MRLYSLDTVFSFGKHRGQTVQQVVAVNPGYIGFCLLNLDHFALRRETAEKMMQLSAAFMMSAPAWAKLDEKEATFAAPEEEDGEDDYYEYYDSSYSRRAEREEQRRDTFYAMTDGQYGDYDD